ncbi:MAG: spore coat associated protein CotJA [Eubacteriales bacterium]|nr:spore coat associated protein CotJA [Eubacteriales bacterium]
MGCINYDQVQVPGMCYVPWQRWQKIYEPGPALQCGTLFPILNKPFVGGCRW